MEAELLKTLRPSSIQQTELVMKTLSPSLSETHIPGYSDNPLNPHPVPLRKLIFDKLFAICALVMVFPLLVTITLILWVTSGHPIFFSHARLGKDGKPFNCLKFRTMEPDSDDQLKQVLENDPIAREEWNTHHKLARDPRVSRFGRFLRQSSLDELPQFWNVLRGEMSIVGPRPITHWEAEEYAGHFRTYALVRPGITGVWQTSGRSKASFADRVEMDVEYIRNWSLSRDIAISWRTLSVIFKADGAF
jgi:exopolysaccharide production protein ExoY